jgi:peptidoglycan/xylan/chitin deacetylase (PgdA/CDA1 family)
MSIFREGLAAAFRFSGMPHLIRAALVRNNATIIFYHDPAPDTVDLHLRYLARYYRFTTMDCLVDAIRSGVWERVPKRALVVTIDDGHRGNAALTEVFARHGVRPLIYLCSQIVGTGRGFWFRVPGIDAPSLKPLPQEERLARLKSQTGWTPALDLGPEGRHALSADELGAMKAHVDFGSHTRFHPILTTCSDAECREEITVSKAEVEALTGGECRHFSFPNGDYSERELVYAEAAGYQSARTIDLGWNGPDSDPYQLKMTGVSDDASLHVLAGQVVGFPTFFSRLLHGSPSGRHKPAIAGSRQTTNPAHD